MVKHCASVTADAGGSVSPTNEMPQTVPHHCSLDTARVIRGKGEMYYTQSRVINSCYQPLGAWLSAPSILSPSLQGVKDSAT